MSEKSQFSKAIDAYVEYYGKHHAPRSTDELRIALKHFEKVTGRRSLEAICREDYNKASEGLTKESWRSKLSRIRGFTQWAQSEYGLLVYTLPRQPSAPPVRGPNARVLEAAALLRSQIVIRAVSERLIFPHERLVMLCGYLYGWSLPRIAQATVIELTDLPQRDDFSRLLEQTCQNTGRQLQMFATWFPNPRKASRIWLKWVGRTARFQAVIDAGNTARMLVGIRPVSAIKLSVYQAAMAELTSENIGRLPRFWGM